LAGSIKGTTGDVTTDLDAFTATTRRPDDDIDLASAALQLAGIVAPVREPERYLHRLDQDADWLRVRIDPDADVEQTARRLAHFLAVDRGLHGNTSDYYDPRNSCLNHVLDTGAGIPITLSVVYLTVGWRIGLPLAGVGLPGHFLVKAVRGDSEVILDPFHGGTVLSRDDCAARLRQVAGSASTLEPHHLAAVTRKQILIRMLNNLKRIYLYPNEPYLHRALAAIEHLLVLSPWALDEVRDRGIVQSLLGNTDAAVRDLETYIEYAHDAADAVQVRQRLANLRRVPPVR
jgi:regulator of sirC expression with transglutaminase-like and TPR domain